MIPQAILIAANKYLQDSGAEGQITEDMPWQDGLKMSKQLSDYAGKLMDEDNPEKSGKVLTVREVVIEHFLAKKKEAIAQQEREAKARAAAQSHAASGGPAIVVRLQQPSAPLAAATVAAQQEVALKTAFAVINAVPAVKEADIVLSADTDIATIYKAIGLAGDLAAETEDIVLSGKILKANEVLRARFPNNKGASPVRQQGHLVAVS